MIKQALVEKFGLDVLHELKRHAQNGLLGLDGHQLAAYILDASDAKWWKDRIDLEEGAHRIETFRLSVDGIYIQSNNIDFVLEPRTVRGPVNHRRRHKQ